MANPPPDPARRHARRHALPRLVTALAVATPTLGWLGGCAGLGVPRVWVFGEAELAAMLQRAFPLQRRLLELLDLQLTEPRLRLLPERNRLALALGLQLRERLGGHALRGRLAFDTALRWEPQDASLRLAQVCVQTLALDDDAPPVPPAAAGRAVPAAARALAERMLEDLPIHRLSAERLAALRQWGLQPGAVTVTARGVELTLARA